MTVLSISNKQSQGTWISDNSHPIPSPSKTDRTTQKVAKESFDFFAKGWGFVDRTISLTRFTLSAIIRTPSWIASGCKIADKGMRSAITKFKLFSIVNVVLYAHSIPSKISTIWQNIKWKDAEGICLSAMAVTLMMGDAFDLLTTFVNALLETLAHATVGWISTMAIPLALFLVGLSLTLKVNSLYRLSKFTNEFDNVILLQIKKEPLSLAELRSTIKPFLHKHLCENVLDMLDSDHKEEIVKRHTSNKILLELKGLVRMLEDNLEDGSVTKITNMIAQIRQSLREEKALQAVSLLSTTISGVAVGLFLTPAAPAAPFVLFGVSASLRLGMQVYQEWKEHYKKKKSLA